MPYGFSIASHVHVWHLAASRTSSGDRASKTVTMPLFQQMVKCVHGSSAAWRRGFLGYVRLIAIVLCVIAVLASRNCCNVLLKDPKMTVIVLTQSLSFFHSLFFSLSVSVSVSHSHFHSLSAELQ